MRSFGFLFICIAIALSGNSKYASAQTWYFGNQSELSFNGVASFGSSVMNASEGCSVVNDAAGNVIMYTDGITVWNGVHVVQNSGNLLPGGVSATQSVIIVPVPCSHCDQFFIFTVDDVESDFDNGFNVVKATVTGIAPNTTISLSVPQLLLSGSSGQIIKVSEKLCAVPDGNEGFWVGVHGIGLHNISGCIDTFSCSHDNMFYFVHVSKTTCEIAQLLNNIVSQSIGSPHIDIGHPYPPSSNGQYNGQGVMKFSPDGHTLALVLPYERKMELFKFMNGVLSNPVYLNTSVPGAFTSADGILYGLEFSADNSKLFVSSTYTSNQRIYQFDLSVWTDTAVAASKYILTSLVGNGTYKFGSIQMAPDGKIYVSRPYTSFLDVIQNPNLSGALCGYTANGQSLISNSRLGMPDVIVNNSCEIWNTGAEQLEDNKSCMRVYPNPANGSVTVTYSLKSIPERIVLYDMSGKSVYTYSPVRPSGILVIDLSGFPDGLYTVVEVSGDVVSVEKILILH